MDMGTLKRLKETGELSVNSRRKQFEREAKRSAKPSAPPRARVTKLHVFPREEHEDDETCKEGDDTIIMDEVNRSSELGKSTEGKEDKGNDGKATTETKKKGKGEDTILFAQGNWCDKVQINGGLRKAGEKTEDKVEGVGTDLRDKGESVKRKSLDTDVTGAKDLRQTWINSKKKGNNTKVDGRTTFRGLGTGTTEKIEDIKGKTSTGSSNNVGGSKDVEKEQQAPKMEFNEEDDYEEIGNIHTEKEPVKDGERDEQEKEPGGTGKEDVNEGRGGDQVLRTLEDDNACARAVLRRLSSEDGRRNGCRQSNALEATTQTKPSLVMSQNNHSSVAESDRGHTQQAAARSRESTSSNPDKRVSHIEPAYETRNWKSYTQRAKGENEVLREDRKHRSERPSTSFYKQLAIEMDAMISKDESSFENVNIKRRPTVIAELYSALCTGEWLNAKQEMDDKMTLDEDVKLKFLCFVLEVSLETAKEVKQSLDAKLRESLVPLLSQPFQTLCCKETSSPKQANPCRELSDQLMTSVSDFLRTHVQEVDVDPLKKRVTTELKEKIEGRKLPALEAEAVVSQDNTDIHEYIKACSCLAWMMVIQRPPMTFQQKGIGERCKELTQDPHWGSSDPVNPRSIVAYYVYPALYHAEKLMQKGRVKLIEK